MLARPFFKSLPPRSRVLLPLYVSCHIQGPYPGSSAFRHLHASGTNRERGGGVEIEQAMGRRTPVRAAEKPISEVLQAGRDEVGAGAEAVAVTVTPEELAQARVIGQVRIGSGEGGHSECGPHRSKGNYDELAEFPRAHSSRTMQPFIDSVQSARYKGRE